jgi:hypothetical protein
VLKRFISLLKPEKGVMVTGRPSGHVQSGYRGGSHVKRRRNRGRISGSTIRRVLRSYGMKLGRKPGRSGRCSLGFGSLGLIPLDLRRGGLESWSMEPRVLL